MFWAAIGEWNSDMPGRKKLNSKDLGIKTSRIPKPTRKVLNVLKEKGYEVYLVGGCVRDLILNRIPKDFDILTSAELEKVVGMFAFCSIVGRRFPICHVKIGGTIVEVSSFSTSRKKFTGDVNHELVRHFGCDDKDFDRWRNCLQRDFTINGLLMFDPYSKKVYDYTRGIEDIRKAKVRTMIPASTSFQEDCARILRAIRIAARLGFSLSRETAHFVKSLSRSVLRLDKARLMMEVNYMLAFGSAEASLRLLWRFGLLELLLPNQAEYFVRQGFGRRDTRSNMLLAVFSNLDKLLAPNRPCHSSLWVGILAFHEALSDHPRDPLVVAAFSLAVHNGGDMSEAINITKRITRPHDISFPELSEPKDLDSPELTNEVMHLADSVRDVLSKMTYKCYTLQAQNSDLAFMSLPLYSRTCRIFDCIQDGVGKGFVSKRGSKINYDLLAWGSLEEVRHVFARTIFDTVFPLRLTQTGTT
ncbi:Polynucleotide adenylyltransferase family protein [Tripterygium wilfordii]|uniref:Polynucleotide adenylyltransferase family protein n=1 Tax=Tripterygium wilfordii TaxID=458696 RepID=A0A7J7DBD3_TRIWF|nr:Polynucleotide adenylyltransferase family protein [Tripterygium wilfordii]